MKKSNLGKLSFKADFLEDVCKGLIYDNNIFTDGEFKYEFHQKVYIMDDGIFNVVKPNFIGRQSKETESI